jgi:hypothetical protein
MYSKMVKYTKHLDSVTACSEVNKNVIKQLYTSFKACKLQETQFSLGKIVFFFKLNLYLPLVGCDNFRFFFLIYFKS